MENPEATSDLIDQLEVDLDDLEDALRPLLKSTPTEIASKLALLDRAKLYVLTTYATESVLFSFLRLNGANAKEHPIFRELARVKQYFEKLKIAENADQRPRLQVDQGAAQRMIKHGLAQKNSNSNGQSYRIEGDEAAKGALRTTANKRKFDEIQPVDNTPTVSKDLKSSPEGASDDSSDESSDSDEAETHPGKPTSNENTASDLMPDIITKGTNPAQESNPKVHSGGAVATGENRKVKQQYIGSGNSHHSPSKKKRKKNKKSKKQNKKP